MRLGRRDIMTPGGI